MARVVRLQHRERFDRRGEIGKPEPPGLLDRLGTEGRHPQGRMRLLHGQRGDTDGRRIRPFADAVLPRHRLAGPGAPHHRRAPPRSGRVFRSAGTSKAVKRAPRKPRPMPRITRPCERRSSTATSSATWIGLRTGSRKEVVPSRSRRGARGGGREQEQRRRDGSGAREVALGQEQRIEAERFGQRGLLGEPARQPLALEDPGRDAQVQLASRAGSAGLSAHRPIISRRPGAGVRARPARRGRARAAARSRARARG